MTRVAWEGAMRPGVTADLPERTMLLRYQRSVWFTAALHCGHKKKRLALLCGPHAGLTYL